MKTRLLVRVSGMSILALAAWPALSQPPGQGQQPNQGFNLFQEAEGGGPRGAFTQNALPSAAQAAPDTALVLKGIYRFGDTYHVSLANSDGGVYKATWKTGDNKPVSVANGFQIQNVDSTTVTMDLPAGMNCQQNVQSGSNCLGRSQVALSFSETAPVSSRRGRTNFGNNNNDTPSFIRDRIDQASQRAGTDIRALIQAAQSGDAAALAQIQELQGGRGGRGGGGGGGGGGRGRGGGGGNNNGGNNFGGRGGN